MPSDRMEPPIDSALTIVIHLPQPLDAVGRVLAVCAELWPSATFTDGLARLEIPADEPPSGR